MFDLHYLRSLVCEILSQLVNVEMAIANSGGKNVKSNWLIGLTDLFIFIILKIKVL
jgi:hypothetical protein